ncbi:MAG TPA: hypothetical protein VFH27_17055 [Longimicrobiaceae bacterium]|nr:hypothetical protein [Longimicrobiaceae bacterium]
MGERIDRSHYPVVLGRLHDPEPVPAVQPSPAECVGMMWELAMNAWAFMGVKPDARMRRDVVHIYRDGKRVQVSGADPVSGEAQPSSAEAAAGDAQPSPSG